MKFGTLFSGGGGADLGLQMAGLKPAWAVEKNEAIARSFSINFPEANLVVSDIKDVDPKDLERVDYIHASPPCQAFSIASRHKFDDNTGLQIIKFIAYHQPKYFTLENVSGFRKSSVCEKIGKALQDYGYFCNWITLDARDYGVPQSRRRFFLMASRSFFHLPRQLPRVGWLPVIKDLIAGGDFVESTLADWQSTLIEKTKSYWQRPLLIPRMGANISTCVPRDGDQPAPTIRAFAKSRGSHWADIALTWTSLEVSPRATARLMTFPDWYKLPEDKKLAQVILGNAVPPLLMKQISEGLI